MKNFKVDIQLNMNASNRVQILVQASNERNAAKIAKSKIIKKYNPLFIIVEFIKTIN